MSTELTLHFKNSARVNLRTLCVTAFLGDGFILISGEDSTKPGSLII